MDKVDISFSKDKKKLIITLPINTPLERSKTGKTLVVASTHGNLKTGVQIEGAELIVGVNAYIKK